MRVLELESCRKRGQALWDPHEFALIVSHRGSVSVGFHGDYG
jgi:hypothetical protein